MALDARGPPAHAQGWSTGRRPADRGRVCGEPGGQPPLAARTREVGDVPGSARATGPHPQGDGLRDTTAGDPNLRGQGPSACGDDGARSGLRAGFSWLLVWVSTRRVRSARSTCSPRWSERVTSTGDLRLPGLHPLLGESPKREVDRLPHNGQGPLSPSAQAHRPVVPTAPARRCPSPAASAHLEATRALRLLWRDRELPRSRSLPPRGETPVVQVAQPPITEQPYVLDRDGTALGALPASNPVHLAPRSSRSEPVIRGAGCGSSARPDLWEPRARDRPGPPVWHPGRRLRRRLGTSATPKCTPTVAVSLLATLSDIGRPEHSATSPSGPWPRPGLAAMAAGSSMTALGCLHPYASFYYFRAIRPRDTVLRSCCAS